MHELLFEEYIYCNNGKFAQKYISSDEASNSKQGSHLSPMHFTVHPTRAKINACRVRNSDNTTF